MTSDSTLYLMKERTLLKLSLICSIVGLFVLYALSETFEITESTISALDEKIGETTGVTGVVQMVRAHNGTTSIEIVKEETITVILFDRGQGIEMGDLIQARGKVDNYKGESELIGEEVRVIG